MYYKLCIEGDSGEKIEMSGENSIKTVEFNLYQDERLANDRSDQLYVDVIICGELCKENKQAVKAISDWSRKKDSASVYKTVSIQILRSDDDEEPERDLYLKSMFCFSYKEEFSDAKNDDDHSWGKFCLKMKQRKGEIKTIKVE
jgi:hypothetical protein